MFTIDYDALTFEIIVMIALNQHEFLPYMTILSRFLTPTKPHKYYICITSSKFILEIRTTLIQHFHSSYVI